MHVLFVSKVILFMHFFSFLLFSKIQLFYTNLSGLLKSNDDLFILGMVDVENIILQSLWLTYQ
jgi:hypothetical protein